MSDDRDLRKNFNRRATLTEEENRTLSINSIRDPKRRAELQEKAGSREGFLLSAAEEDNRKLQEMFDEEWTRVSRAALDFVVGVAKGPKSVEQLKAELWRKIDRTAGVVMRQHQAEREKKLNRDLDRDIDAALKQQREAREEKPKERASGQEKLTKGAQRASAYFNRLAAQGARERQQSGRERGSKPKDE